MSPYLAVALLVVVAILQTSAVPHLRIWGVYPDLPLLVVVSWGVLRGPKQGAAWGITAGLAVDLLSGGPKGAGTLSLMTVGLLAGLAQAAAPRGYLVLPLAAAFLGTVVYDLIWLVSFAISARTVLWVDALFRVVLPSAVLNTLLEPAVYWVMRALHKRIGREEMAW